MSTTTTSDGGGGGGGMSRWLPQLRRQRSTRTTSAGGVVSLRRSTALPITPSALCGGAAARVRAAAARAVLGDIER